MDRKLLIAIGVSVGLGVVWSVVFMRQKKGAPPPQPATPGAAPAPAAPLASAAPSPAPAAANAPAKKAPAAKPGVAPPAAAAPRTRGALMYVAKHELYTAKFVDQGATLVSFELNRYETKDRKAPMDLVSAIIRDPASRPLAVELLEDPEAAKILHALHDCELTLRPGTDLADTLTCTWSDEKRLDLVKRIRFRPGSYALDIEVELRNRSAVYLATTLALQVTAFQGRVAGGGCFEPPPDVAQPICLLEKSVERESIEDLLKKHGGKRPIDGFVQWTGVDQRYFLSAVIPRDARDADGEGILGKSRCELVVRGGSAVGARLIPKRDLKIPSGQTAVARFAAYLGPKEHKLLESVAVDRGGRPASPELERAVDFGWLAVLCKPMLWLMNLFYGFTGNYGIAIIFLTFVVKVITFWPSQRAYRSMEGMRKLKEPMEEIRRKYANDKNRMNQELISLYKAHKINPLGGCLPLLIQLPIWIALYRTIYSAVELYQQPFAGWIDDLSAKDPYYILPIILGAVMFVQQKMTPTSGDSAQMKLMLYGMPALFTAMMLFFPSGLVLYIFVNTVLSILQQWLIKRSAAKAR